MLVLAASLLAFASLHAVSDKWPVLTAGDIDNLRSGGPMRPEPGAGTYAAIALHPVFEPSRQPWLPLKVLPPMSIPPIAAPPPPSRYALVGLVLTAGQHAAMLRDSAGRTRIIAEGQTLDGWSVRAIDATGVHLNEDRHRFTLTMSKQGH